MGRDLTIEEGYTVARWGGVCLLASLKREIGDLSRVKRILQVFGMAALPRDQAVEIQMVVEIGGG